MHIDNTINVANTNSTNEVIHTGRPPTLRRSSLSLAIFLPKFPGKFIRHRMIFKYGLVIIATYSTGAGGFGGMPAIILVYIQQRGTREVAKGGKSRVKARSNPVDCQVGGRNGMT